MSEAYLQRAKHRLRLTDCLVTAFTFAALVDTTTGQPILHFLTREALQRAANSPEVINLLQSGSARIQLGATANPQIPFAYRHETFMGMWPGYSLRIILSCHLAEFTDQVGLLINAPREILLIQLLFP